MTANMERPWENEPDFNFFEAFGFPCYIIRHPEYKTLCGYVGVPPTHPLYGVGKDDESACLHEILRMRNGYVELEKASMFTLVEIMLDGWKPTPAHAFEVHRGITFSGNLETEITGERYSSHWFLGFDCSHGGDYKPGIVEMNNKLKEIIPDLPDLSFMVDGTYRTMEYVEAEVRKLAMQLSFVVPIESNQGETTST